MKKILFIGSFLHKSRGSLSTIYKLSLLLSDKCKISLASEYENKIIRLLEIMLKCLFSNADIIIVGAFSDKAFTITEASVLMSSYRKKNVLLGLHGGKLIEFYKKNEPRIDKVFRKCNFIYSPSLMLKEYFESKGHQVNYIPNPIDLSIFQYHRDNIKPYSLLWVRAFDPIYNPDLAILTLSIVRKHYPQARLTMIGPDKGLLEKSKAIMEELNLSPYVEFLGAIPNFELYKYYQTHSIFLNTTSYESFGVAVLEAAACGIPIVSTPAGEIPLLWKDEEEILIAKDWSPESMAKAVIRILKEQELSRLLSENARKKAEQFESDKIKKKWFELLENNLY